MSSRRTYLTALGAVGVLSGLPISSLARSPDTETYDVIIIGSGAAGCSAALAAAELGARVLVLEKQAIVGGNTRVSGGFYAAVNPEFQKALGIEDSFELFEQQILENGGGRSDPQLARILAYGATDMLTYLKSLGVRFKDEIIEIYGAHWRRCHKPAMPNGEGYINTLHAAALRLEAKFLTQAAATRLIKESGRVVGVEFRHGSALKKAYARCAVVCASGGFGANAKMVEQYFPALSELSHDNTPGSTGEVLLMAQEAGAQLIDMDLIQCLPGCPPNRTHRVRLHNDVSRFIFVDSEGSRFIREDDRRDVLRDKILALPNRTAFSIVDADGLRSYDILMQKEAVLGVETGDAWCADTIESLARAMGLPPERLKQTVDEYNAGVRRGVDVFGKEPSKLRHEIKTAPFWGCYAAMAVHYTMGGIRINEHAQALDAQGQVIPGLYAAGEASGGVHGRNRMGANGINDALVFGRIAGRHAVQNNRG